MVSSPRMPLTPGDRLGPYEILGPIGSGGMGEVYRARDTRLDRQVAVKVLPAHLSASAELKQRFEREARAVSSLNHPHICTLHDVGRQDDVDFLVMEHLEGESLADRIRRGPIPLDEALRIADQIAGALDAAHRRGVVHRDLKPGNIMITRTGAKLLDFGLAKTAADAAPPLSSTAMTQASPLTVEGTIVGTFHYMSPEQLEGKAADARSDIFSFGAVLYEMVTGRRAFDGKSQASLIAGIMEREAPSLAAIAPAVPRALDRLVRTCLAKDPDARWGTAHDVMLQIRGIMEGGTPETEAPVARGARGTARSARIAWAIVAILVILSGWLAMRPAPPAAGLPRLAASITPPAGAGFDIAVSRALALSPDGLRIVFAARDAQGTRRLYLRDLDRTGSRPIEGTENARAPFWSPDGRYLAFFAAGALRRIEIATGLTEVLAEVTRDLGGSWGARGDIIFSNAAFDRIMRIPAGGGTPVPVTTVETEGTDSHLMPFFLPDGNRFLYYVRRYGSGDRLGQVRLGSLDGSISKDLFPANSGAAWALSGHVIWWHGGNLRAQRLDPDRAEMIGEAIPLIPDVRFDPRTGFAAFSVSKAGWIVYQEGGAVSGDELVWIDRQGNDLGRLGDPGSLYGPRISPDGTRVALDISGETNQGDIWILDVARGSGTRFTVFPEDDSSPVWSPDGTEVAFFSMTGGQRPAIYARPARGSADPRRLLGDPEAGIIPTDWSRDGSLIVRHERGGNSDLWVYSVADGAARPYLATSFNEDAASVSPDGRFLAYMSDETGRPEVYVGTFPDPGGERWRISPEGGLMPLWRPDGTEIFYVDLDDRLMAVPVTGGSGADGSPAFGQPVALFRTDLKPHWSRQYDTRDGQRFLVNRNVQVGAADPVTILVNWQQEID